MHLGHLDRLELSHDGYISPRLREGARILDQLEEKFRQRKAARTRTRVKHLKPAGHVERLALAMISIAGPDGVATRRDLKARGFSDENLDTYGDLARVRAEEIKADRERANAPDARTW